jgi:hypothetical protein
MHKEAISRLFVWKSVERNNDPVWRVLLNSCISTFSLEEFAIAKSGYYLHRVCLSVRLFVRMERSVPNGRIFMKFDV